MYEPCFPENETERLSVLHSLNVLDTNSVEKLDRVTRLAAKYFGVSIALISLIDRERQWFLSRSGLDARETPRNISFCGHAILQRDALVVPDTAADPRFFDTDALIGTEGQGWSQVTAELAFERSGPERFLSSIALIHTLIDAVGRNPDALQAKEIGRLAARLVTLRNMSLSVTAQLAAGENPTWAASCVKDLGAVFEQEIPELAQLLCDIPPTAEGGSDHAQVLAYLTQMAPSFSLRGGTREILRGIIARGLGLR